MKLTAKKIEQLRKAAVNQAVDHGFDCQANYEAILALIEERMRMGQALKQTRKIMRDYQYHDFTDLADEIDAILGESP